MPGGQGGKDIWMMKKVKRDEWSTPINLGDQINTSGDELYPFIHPNGDLFDGSWVEGNAEGFGYFYQEKGSVYKGMWANDK